MQDAKVGQEFVDFEGMFSEGVFSKGGGGIGLAHLSKPADRGLANPGEMMESRAWYRSN